MTNLNVVKIVCISLIAGTTLAFTSPANAVTAIGGGCSAAGAGTAAAAVAGATAGDFLGSALSTETGAKCDVVEHCYANGADSCHKQGKTPGSKECEDYLKTLCNKPENSHCSDMTSDDTGYTPPTTKVVCTHSGNNPH